MEQTETIDLNELKKLIEEADGHASSAVGFAGVRIKICARIGHTLKEYKKQVGHGHWLQWLQENLQELTDRTARKWMKLAEAVEQGKLDLDNAKSVRQAYILAGILPEPEESPSNHSSDAVSYLVHLDRFETEMRNIDIAQLSLTQRETLRQRLQPVATLYAKLIEG
jgi:hypothetical protein